MGANFFGEAGTKAAVARLMKGIIFWNAFDSKITDFVIVIISIEYFENTMRMHDLWKTLISMIVCKVKDKKSL